MVNEISLFNDSNDVRVKIIDGELVNFQKNEHKKAHQLMGFFLLRLN